MERIRSQGDFGKDEIAILCDSFRIRSQQEATAREYGTINQTEALISGAPATQNEHRIDQRKSKLQF